MCQFLEPQIDPLTPSVARMLDQDGYIQLHDAIPADWLPRLRTVFESALRASDDWPVPRGHDWRHAQVDLDARVRNVCRLPMLLSAVAHIIRGPFFLSQVEGRDPRHGNATQALHRDVESETPQHAIAFAYLDDFDACNGATQVVAGSHRRGHRPSEPTILQGKAGDVMVMDARLIHGATTNRSGAPRRTLLIAYAAEVLSDMLAESATIRGVRMSTAHIFIPGLSSPPTAG